MNVFAKDYQESFNWANLTLVNNWETTNDLIDIFNHFGMQDICNDPSKKLKLERNIKYDCPDRKDEKYRLQIYRLLTSIF
jgi:hypothetical protein